MSKMVNKEIAKVDAMVFLAEGQNFIVGNKVKTAGELSKLVNTILDFNYVDAYEDEAKVVFANGEVQQWLIG